MPLFQSVHYLDKYPFFGWNRFSYVQSKHHHKNKGGFSTLWILKNSKLGLTQRKTLT